jgi:PadR family transcriptional regulator
MQEMQQNPLDNMYCMEYSVHDTPYATHAMTSTSPNSTDPELFDALRLELRRGCLVVAVLAQLKSEQYGYTLRKSLAEDGLLIDESTLYPLLRRLESQGLLLSEWREENKRNKRFYLLSPAGAHVLEQLLDEWRAMNAALERILGNSATRPAQKPDPIAAETYPSVRQPIERPADVDKNADQEAGDKVAPKLAPEFAQPEEHPNDRVLKES